MKLVPAVLGLATALWLAQAHAEPSADEWLARGLKLMEATDMARAFDAFSRAVALDPGNAVARSWMMGIADAPEQQREVLALLTRAAEKRPRDPSVAVDLSNFFRDRRGDLGAAVQWRLRAAALEPDGPAKWEALDTVGVLSLRRLERAEIPADERLRIASEGIAAFEVVAARVKDPTAAHAYLSSLYRRRAAAQRSPAARDADLAKAQRHHDRAWGPAKKP